MDKEDCIQVLLSTLQQPLWKSCDSVTDWDLKNVLWKAGLLLTPEQVAALFADMKRRGLITARDRRSEDRIVALWNVKIAPSGEEWLAQRGQAESRGSRVVIPSEVPSSEEPAHNNGSGHPEESEPLPEAVPGDLQQGDPNTFEQPDGRNLAEDASVPN